MLKSPAKYFVQKKKRIEKKNKSTARQGNIRLFTILQGYPIYIAEQKCKMIGPLQMYACYVVIVTSYGVKKDSLKRISQREVIEKGRAIF